MSASSGSSSEEEEEDPVMQYNDDETDVFVRCGEEITSHRGGEITPPDTTESSSSDEEPIHGRGPYALLKGGTGKTCNQRFAEVERRRQQNPVTAEVVFPAGRLVL